MSLPLSGITVLSLEQAIAAPLGSRHLADWGARVIKIERPDSSDFARGYDAIAAIGSFVPDRNVRQDGPRESRPDLVAAGECYSAAIEAAAKHL